MAGKFDFATLEVNKAIKSVFGGIIDTAKFATSGRTVAGSGRSMRTGESQAVQAQRKMGLLESAKAGHRAKAGDWDNISGYSASKIAGSYIGLSAAGRIATGGGLYRDSNGNADVIGLPLI